MKKKVIIFWEGVTMEQTIYNINIFCENYKRSKKNKVKNI